MRTTRDWVTRQLDARGDGNGEDRLGAWSDPASGCVVAVLCDGAGGIPGGARAAELACAGLLRGLPHTAPSQLLAALDQQLLDDPLAGECTAVAAVIAPDGAVTGASCGDSAAVLDGAVLTDRQHRKRRLGSGRALPVPFSGRGRRLLLCTDGLSGLASAAQLGEHMAGPLLRRAADALVRAAHLPSGELTDDVALVLIDLRP